MTTQTWSKVSDDISATLASYSDDDLQKYGLHEIDIWLVYTSQTKINTDAPDVNALLALHTACQTGQNLEVLKDKFNTYLDILEDFAINSSSSQIGAWATSQALQKKIE